MGKCEQFVQLLSPFFDNLRKMETQLKCPVCNDLLEDPKLLPCDHIICQNCLPIVEGKKQTCPVCGKFRPKGARRSLLMEEMIKVFNEVDAAISDILKKIMSDKAPTFEDYDLKAIPRDFKEGSHVGQIGDELPVANSEGEEAKKKGEEKGKGKVEFMEFTEMMAATERPEKLGFYSGEMFQAHQLPFMEKYAENPARFLTDAMGHIHELGCMLVHIRDKYAREFGKMKIPEVTATQHSKELLQENYETLGKVRGGEKKADDAAMNRITQLEEDLKKLQFENNYLRNIVAESCKQHLHKFLRSVSFKKAVLYAGKDQTRSFIYEVLKNLSSYYPFIPDQIGYGPTPPELAKVKDLSEYEWDETMDVLKNPEKGVLPKLGSLQNLPVTGIIYQWKKSGLKWPEDVTKEPSIPTSESSEDEDKEEPATPSLESSEEEDKEEPSTPSSESSEAEDKEEPATPNSESSEDADNEEPTTPTPESSGDEDKEESATPSSEASEEEDKEEQNDVGKDCTSIFSFDEKCDLDLTKGELKTAKQEVESNQKTLKQTQEATRKTMKRLYKLDQELKADNKRFKGKAK